jgi:uncharacterized phage protein (TIGR01671 family)
MRQIKFRAWDTKENKMCEWDDLRDTGLFSDALDGKDAVLMQFTELLDKNGKEIYEGDIIRRRNGDKYNAGIGVVEYTVFNSQKHPILGYWASVNEEESFTIYPDCEVIGNIYSDLELLA